VEEIERRFHRAMVAIYETAKNDLGYNGTFFVQMLGARGGVATARQLLWSTTPSEGFTTLRERGRLDLTSEALILRADFEALFSDDDRRHARERLEAYGWRDTSGDG
jgi:hypothetical protein